MRMPYRMFASLLVSVTVLSTTPGCRSSSDNGNKLQVAAAADLALAFAEIGKAFDTVHHSTTVFTFGSTGLLAKQIGEGAPYSLFAAANESFVKDVIAKGKCDGATMRRYARGRIVVWTPSSVKAPSTLADLKDERFKRIAIANPEHAPYGKAAKEALQSVGIWDAVESRIKTGENVRATLQFAQTGNVDAAIIALSLSVATEGGASLPIDPGLHQPLDQALAVCGTGKATELATAFADYVVSAEGREVMTRYGFSLPEPSK
jgi:molybdate transport system substrate-binding protein